jgi:hypothetical protein
MIEPVGSSNGRWELGVGIESPGYLVTCQMNGRVAQSGDMQVAPFAHPIDVG